MQLKIFGSDINPQAVKQQGLMQEAGVDDCIGLLYNTADTSCSDQSERGVLDHKSNYGHKESTREAIDKIYQSHSF